MTDDKPVPEQVHKSENLCVEIWLEGMNICDIFQADCLLDNLSPSWSSYGSNMKHKEKDFKLEELIAHIKMKP